MAFTTYGCSDTLLKEDRISIGGPNAKIILPDTICYSETNKLYLDEKVNLYRNIWNLGDGTSSEGDTVYHTYTQKGYVPMNVLLISDSSNTCNKYLSDTIYISDYTTGFLVKDNITEGCVPVTI